MSHPCSQYLQKEKTTATSSLNISVTGEQGCDEFIATLPPFGPIGEHKWFFHISNQWESQKNRFSFISFGKIKFLPPCFWDLPFMSYCLRQRNCAILCKAVSQPTNRQIESVNRERESVVALVFFGFHYRISLSTITFEFRTISVSVSPLIFLQRYRSCPNEIER